jgi:hypothetical protein
MAVPKPKTKISHTELSLTNPDYDEKQEEWKFNHDAVTGKGGFAPYRGEYNDTDLPFTEEEREALQRRRPSVSGYLQPFPGEGWNYDWRRRRAYYHNALNTAVKMLVGMLTRRKPRREYSDIEKTHKWMDSVSAKHLSFDDWISTEVLPKMITFGEVLTLYTNQFGSDDYASRAEQDAAAKIEGLPNDIIGTTIDPRTMMDWSTTSGGRYRYLKTKEETNFTGVFTKRAMPSVHDIGYLYKCYNDEGWWTIVQPKGGSDEFMKMFKAPMVWKSGEWPAKLSGPPIAVWRIGETGESIVSEAAAAARMHYNISSALINTVYKTCFAMLTGPELAPGKSGMISTGEGNYLAVPESSQAGKWPQYPNYIQPDSGTFTIMIELLNLLFSAQRQMTGLGFLESVGTTGPARRFDFAYVNAYLSSLVGDLAEGEHETMMVVSALHKETYTDEMRAKYPDSFEAVDVEAFMASLKELADLDPPVEVVVEGLKRALTVVLGDAGVDKIQELEKVLDEWGKVMKNKEYVEPDDDEEDEGDGEEEDTDPGEKKDGTSIPDASNPLA